MLKLACILISFSTCAFAQYRFNNTPVQVNKKLHEISGIIIHEKDAWVINDGGNSNEIFRIDIKTGDILQAVIVKNATNVDWEEITASNTEIYIGDFGNNNGNRKNLCVYRIRFADLSPDAAEVSAEKIHFVFDDQELFKSQPQNNNYDCEAMVYFNDSLHLFTKQWQNQETSHYIMSAVPGVAIARKTEVIKAGFLVTGASIFNGQLALCGYNNQLTAAYILTIGFPDPISDNRSHLKNYTVIPVAGFQVEGIVLTGNGKGILVNEKSHYNFDTDASLSFFNIQRAQNNRTEITVR
jgi:hypothetical protein